MTTIPIYFVVLPNTLLTDLAISADALLYANRFQNEVIFELHYVGVRSHTSTSIGLALTNVQPLPSTLPAHAVVIIPGVAGDWQANADTTIDAATWLRDLPREQKLITICAGGLLAAQAGRLQHRRCTTHHCHYDDLRRLEPTAALEMNRMYVEDGHIMTSAGVTAGLDVTLRYIEKTTDAHCAASVAQHMVVYQRRASLDPEPSPLLQHRNHIHPAVHRVQTAILANPTHAWAKKDMADIACVSPRHLTRLFKQEAGVLPHEYLRKIRIGLAQQLNLERWHSQEELAYRVGFSSAQQLRRAMKQTSAYKSSK